MPFKYLDLKTLENNFNALTLKVLRKALPQQDRNKKNISKLIDVALLDEDQREQLDLIDDVISYSKRLEINYRQKQELITARMLLVKHDIRISNKHKDNLLYQGIDSAIGINENNKISKDEECDIIDYLSLHLDFKEDWNKFEDIKRHLLNIENRMNKKYQNFNNLEKMVPTRFRQIIIFDNLVAHLQTAELPPKEKFDIAIAAMLYIKKEIVLQCKGYLYNTNPKDSCLYVGLSTALVELKNKYRLNIRRDNYKILLLKLKNYILTNDIYSKSNEDYKNDDNKRINVIQIAKQIDKFVGKQTIKNINKYTPLIARSGIRDKYNKKLNKPVANIKTPHELYGLVVDDVKEFDKTQLKTTATCVRQTLFNPRSLLAKVAIEAKKFVENDKLRRIQQGKQKNKAVSHGYRPSEFRQIAYKQIAQDAKLFKENIKLKPTKTVVKNLLKEPIHQSEYYKAQFHDVLDELKNNNEKLKPVGTPAREMPFWIKLEKGGFTADITTKQKEPVFQQLHKEIINRVRGVQKQGRQEEELQAISSLTNS